MTTLPRHLHLGLPLLAAALLLTGCNATGSRTLPNGAAYKGQLNDRAMPEGKGVADYSDGRRYDGEWAGGQWNGHGVLSFGDGSKYDGEFHDGKANGNGVFARADGERDEGSWRDGECDGLVVHTSPRGCKMETEYRDGRKVKSSGTTHYKEGTVQSGRWDNATGVGAGVIEWVHGQRYEGAWRNVGGDVDQPDGEGTMTYADGRKYVGQFTAGRMNGHGVMTYPDGKAQDGQWKDGKFVGK